MSAIDQYKHRLLGFIECPSTYDIVSNNQTRKIPIYELHEDIPSTEKDFDGKTGDLLLGGGTGEAPALRISIPEAINFFIKNEGENIERYEDLLKPFWTPTESYKYGEGFVKIGWGTNTPIEFWLAENLCQLLIEKLDQYHPYKTRNEGVSNLTFLENK